MPRPLINIDPKEVEGYARLGSPVTEIADFLGVHESTIRRRFRKEIKKSRAARRITLRQFQWKEARDGNVTMLIFLGKLELGQRDDQAGLEDRMIVRRLVKRN
jgi:predicted transcriptional regulator